MTGTRLASCGGTRFPHVIPDIFNPLPSFPMSSIPPLSFPTFSTPFRHSRHLQPPSVIPDVFNRESMAFPMQDHTNEGTEEKNTGFPLTTGGNDRGGRRECQRGPSGYDRRARAGMTEGTGRVCQRGQSRHANRLAESMAFPIRDHTIPPCHSRHLQSPSVIPDVFNPLPSFPTSSTPFCHSRRLQPPSVIPDVFNRESMAFPMQDHTNEGTEEKNTGFPLTTGGNDRGGRRECQREPSGYARGDQAGMTEGPEQACQQACRIHGVSHAGPHDSVHVIPDVFNPLPSFPTFLIPFCHSRRF